MILRTGGDAERETAATLFRDNWYSRSQMSSQPQTGMEERDDAARELDSETAAVEFKSAFKPADKGEFLEILAKHI